MLYAPEKGFIFIHIWKTGGESVVAALKPYCPVYFRNRYVNKAIRIAPGLASLAIGWRARLVSGQHMTANEIRESMPHEAFDRTFRFTFVRNPWDWQVSAYHYAIQTPAHPLNKTICSLGSFDAFIRYQCEQNAPSQSSFLLDANGNRIVDFVGRFERIDEDFQAICGKLGIEATLPRLNASRRNKDWRSYYTEETKALVGELFRRDIEAFGYRWE